MNMMLRRPLYASLSFLQSSIKLNLVTQFGSKVQVNVVSEETIKPSSPTPPHLRTFKRSLLDQLGTGVTYTPFIFFYPASDHAHLKTEDKLARLKDSLSKTLTRFYPVAGKIKNRSSVDCNDDGAPYMEAHVNCQMLEFLKHPQRNLDCLQQFIPCDPIFTRPQELASQVAIKVSVFECGGIAVGVCMLHTIIDVFTISIFVKEWAAIARGESITEAYAHDMGALIFPPNEDVVDNVSSQMVNYWAQEEKTCVRRFVLDKTAITVLKDKARSDLVMNPTAYEVVSALIWKSVMTASTTLVGSHNPTVMTNVVNLRPRMKSPLPDFSVGNLDWITAAFYDPIEGSMELSYLVSLQRKSIEKINGDYIRSIQGKEGREEFSEGLNLVGEMGSRVGKAFSYVTSGINKMGFYGVDFGFGKPTWVGWCAHSVYDNTFVLMEGRLGNGIEAWLVLDKSKMALIESDHDFLQYATLNPSIDF